MRLLEVIVGDREQTEEEKAQKQNPEIARRGDVFFVFEYVPHDLSGLLAAGYTFSPELKKSLVLQLLQALQHLHSLQFIHRDLKSSNLLITAHHQLKLADFGLARRIESHVREMTYQVITLWYRPPELLLGQTVYGTEIDMWSFACIVYELYTFTPLFAGRDEITTLDLIAQLCGKVQYDTSSSSASPSSSPSLLSSSSSSSASIPPFATAMLGRIPNYPSQLRVCLPSLPTPSFLMLLV